MFQCPTCIGEGKDEATAKANCDINIKKKTCSRKTPVCAVYYISELRRFARHCMNQILYDKTVEKCQSKGCKAEKCTQPGCMGGEMPGMNVLPFCTKGILKTKFTLELTRNKNGKLRVLVHTQINPSNIGAWDNYSMHWGDKRSLNVQLRIHFLNI